MIDIWAWMFLVSVLCHQHNLPVSEALATAHVESRDKSHEFRFGPMGKGKYSGAFGIARCFQGADDPCLNTVLGVEALARLKKRKGSLRGALKVYNAECDRAYLAAVEAAVRKYQALD